MTQPLWLSIQARKSSPMAKEGAGQVRSRGVAAHLQARWSHSTFGTPREGACELSAPLCLCAGALRESASAATHSGWRHRCLRREPLRAEPRRWGRHHQWASKGPCAAREVATPVSKHHHHTVQKTIAPCLNEEGAVHVVCRTILRTILLQFQDQEVTIVLV